MRDRVLAENEPSRARSFVSLIGTAGLRSAVRGWQVWGLIACSSPAIALADEHVVGADLTALTQETERIGGSAPKTTFLDSVLGTGPGAVAPGQSERLDLSPLVGGFLAFMRRQGIPFREDRDKAENDVVAVSMEFRVATNLPAVSLRVGESGSDSFGAFYATRKDVSWAFVMRADPLSLRLEGGDHQGEFGNYAIAGAQWRSPSRPLAVGVGIPMNLSNARGEVGVILQIRFNLDADDGRLPSRESEGPRR